MTLPEAMRIFRYWRKSPPTHELMAVQVRYEPPKTFAEKMADGAMTGDQALAAAMAARMAKHAT